MKNELEINKINGDVAFNEEQHTYWNTRNKDLKYISITTIIGNYHEKFDEEFWSSYKAIERIVGVDVFKGMSIKRMLLDVKCWKDDYLKFVDIDRDLFFETKLTIKKEYKDNKDAACERGTAYHLMRENQWYENKRTKAVEYIENDTIFDVEKNNWDLNRENAILPEYLVYYSSPDGLVNLAGQIDLLIKEKDSLYVLDFKGLSLDTPIATCDGFKLMKDINIGDIIFDGNGKQTKVKHVSDIHYNPCYKIKFDNNDEIICDHEHKWEVDFCRPKGQYKTKELKTDELYDIINNNKKRDSYHIPKVRIFDELELEEKDLPLDPYILGAWLGDGSKSCGIISNVNPDFWNEVEKRGFKTSDDLNRNHDRSEMRTIYNIYPILRSLNLINNKHIPDIYFRASKSQRLDLLRGLMDTDGYFNPGRNRFVMGTTQEWQANDVAKLVATFGIKPTTIKCTKVCGDKKFQGWDTCFYMEENPFLIRNQNIEFKLKTKSYYKFRNILSIEKIDTVPTKCLAVESDVHTYLAGYNMIKTHNTNSKGIDKKAFFNSKTKQTKKMYYPINNIEDTTFNHYALQLSFYAYMLKQINKDFKIKKLQLLHNSGDGETKIDVPFYENEVKKIIADLWTKNNINREK